MKLVIQRVSSAQVTVDERIVGRIGKGYVVLIGVGENDTCADADIYLKKLINLRIFEDADGKTNLSIRDVDGGLLMISQFTLCADCRKGNRPSFFHAGDPRHAEELYEYMIRKAKEQIKTVEKGEFGAHMKVELVNDGPFTIVLEDL